MRIRCWRGANSTRRHARTFQALDLARQEKSPRLEARAHLALGSLGTQDGSFDDAVSHLDSALKFYRRQATDRDVQRADSARARLPRQRRVPVAMKAFSEQLQLAKQSGDPARLAATHSSIAVLLGDNQELYAEALPYFEESYRINKSIGARVSMGWIR